MKIYIALLRGINVGTKNRIKMVDLKGMFERLGFEDVKTYIQSGNVIFKSALEEEVIKQKIEKEFELTFGFLSTVVLRNSEELENVIKGCPFSDEQIAEAKKSCEGECLNVAFLTKAPLEEKIGLLNAYKYEDEYKVIGRDVFLLFNKSIRNSKLANNLHRLEVPTTVRNWKTVNKLFELVKEMGY